MQGRAIQIGLGVIVALAGLWFGLQSLVLVNLRANPELASQISAFPARADERLAISMVEADESGITDLGAAIPLAERAFAASALRGEASAILALGQPSAEERGAALAAITDLQKRGRLLNFARLQHAAETGDIALGLGATDRLLTLYPSIRQRLVPVLGTFLAEDGAMELYEELLASRPVWVDQFFGLWQIDDESMRRLGLLRLSMGRDAGTRSQVDQQLVLRLIDRGHFAEASELYSLISDGADTNGLAIDWQDEFPPFDWQLANERDFHARPSSTSDGLRLRIDAGQGGTLARRFVTVPQGATDLEIDFSLESGPRDAELELTLTCQPVATSSDVALGRSTESPATAPLPEGECSLLEVMLEGRVFTGQSDLRAQLRSMRFVQGG